jgi:hypothetical protein
MTGGEKNHLPKSKKGWHGEALEPCAQRHDANALTLMHIVQARPRGSTALPMTPPFSP